MNAWFFLRWSDSGGGPATWFVFRTAQHKSTLTRYTELVAKCDRWHAAEGVKVSALGVPGHVRIDAARVVYDTAAPGVITFVNESARVALSLVEAA